MFNRTPYNRAPYNRKARFVFEWTATANVESGSGGAVLIIRYLSGEAEAGTDSSGVVVRVLLPSGSAEAVAEGVGPRPSRRRAGRGYRPTGKRF